MVRVTIIDGYIDEPACLGVPPYVSPYPRYIAGAVWNNDSKSEVFYYTIEQIRNNPSVTDTISMSDIVIVIAGMAVPGRYLSGYPASPREIIDIITKVDNSVKILCGPAAIFGFGLGGGRHTQTINEYFDYILTGDPEIFINSFLDDKQAPTDIKRENAETIKDYAVKGANITKMHPYYPDYLITEIETYRGCPRTYAGGCSFCSEPRKGLPDFRSIKSIVKEIQALYNCGIRHFRLGNQPCIFSYQAKDTGKTEFPKPNPDALEKLFKNIRQTAPDLKTLHIDNANPGTIAKHPKESEKIAKTIVKYHTPGDVAAMGVESTDPVVIKQNNLKANAEEAMQAIKILNKIGKKRGSNGLPELLPGLNFLYGLKGETKKTYEQNYSFLEEIKKQDLLLRRINIRQIIPIPGTKNHEEGFKILKKNKKHFIRFKKQVKQNIEQPLLKKLIPPKTIIKDVYLEKQDGKTIFGRQIGSYPLLIGIPGINNINQFIDVKITDYGYRSVTGIPHPLNINTASRQTLETIPKIGKKRALRLLANRPFKNKKEIINTIDDPEITKELLEYFQI